MTASAQQIENAMDLTAVLTIEQIAADERIGASKALTDFLASNTAAQLFDDSLKRWWEGPSSLADAYEAEKAARQQAAGL